MLCLESNAEDDYATSSTASEQTPHMPMTAFSAMMALQRRSGVSTNAQNLHNSIGVPGSNSIKEVSEYCFFSACVFWFVYYAYVKFSFALFNASLVKNETVIFTCFLHVKIMNFFHYSNINYHY